MKSIKDLQMVKVLPHGSHLTRQKMMNLKILHSKSRQDQTQVEKKKKSANLVEEAKKSLVQSVLQHLQSANKEKTSTKKTRIERKYGEVLTENQVLKQLKDEEAKKMVVPKTRKTEIPLKKSAHYEFSEKSGISAV
ncbi:hypothetical protein BpHYR1_051903 [Brachionus plicatilis]|uniref:Uncharacterized protein n=1 Tax=Brachionus plicatilis TaxID=10195 RepID=A0A3M7RM60_BRAPC|nr:hypothetical protein BpHYR1_051903 [Brachionus plicatilis]